MAIALRILPRRLLRPLHLQQPSLLSSSASPSDHRELLRIQRILSSPSPTSPQATAASPSKRQEDPQPQATAAAPPTKRQQGPRPQAAAASPSKRQEDPRPQTTAAAPPTKRLQGPRPQAAAAVSDLHRLLHRAAGLTADEATSLLRGIPNKHRLRCLLEELSRLRLSGDEIRNALGSDPDGLLSMSPGELSRLVELVDGLRCRSAVKDRILSHGVLAAAVVARRRVELLHARGLTHRDALHVLALEPRAMLYRVEDVDRKVEFLVSRMGFEVQWLVEHPAFLGVNLDRWIVPRHNVVEYLISVGGLGDPIEMKHYVKFSRHKFYNMFVKPYPECQRIFGGLVRDKENEVKRQHPTGLWKLFKPAKYDSTKEDVKNMKTLMESLH